MTSRGAVLRGEYRLPPVIVGCWQLSNGHQRRPRSSTAVLDDLVRLVADGFTTFDCADIYTGVEALLGTLRQAVHQRLGREAAARLRVHTKLVPDRSRLNGIDRAYVEGIVHRSLRRLGVERLDMVQFAWWDYDVPRWVEVAEWLNELRAAGLIQHLGVTNFDVPRLREILAGGVVVAANQLQYSALDHRAENGMAALCRTHGVHLLCYGSLAGGFLSDQYVAAPDPGEALANRSLTKYRLIIQEFGGWAAFQSLLLTLRRVAEEHQASVAQVAIAYVLARPGVASVIVGMSRPERLRQAGEAAAIALTPEQESAIRSLAASQAGPSGDCFDLERTQGGPHAAIMKYDLNQEPTAPEGIP